MIFYIIILLSALSISGTGAYFSILGLATMFPGAAWSVIVMGSVLEVGKIVSAIWLHMNWKEANKLMKAYLTTAVVVLMLITSMGIFGFLSKAHIEHSYLTEKETAAVEQIDEKILREEQFIARQSAYIDEESKRLTSSKDVNLIDIQREEKRIEQINTQLNKDVEFEQSRSDKLTERRRELDTAVANVESQAGGLFSSKKQKLEELKASQADERASIDASLKEIEGKIDAHRKKAETQIQESRSKIASFQQSRGGGQDQAKQEIEKYNKLINEANDRINELQVQKISYDEKVRSLEAEVGPVKYIAKLFEDLGSSEISLDKAVRIVIIVLIFVFDPLAVLLVLAGVSGLHQFFHKKKDNTLKTTANFAAPDPKEIEQLKRQNDLQGKQIKELGKQLAGFVSQIIAQQKQDEKKDEYLFQQQETKTRTLLSRARVQLNKTKRLIKNNYNKILVNSKRSRENKAAGASNFKKIVSSIKTKIEKF